MAALRKKKKKALFQGLTKSVFFSCETVFTHLLFLMACCLRSSTQLLIWVPFDKLFSTVLRTCPSLEKVTQYQGASAILYNSVSPAQVKAAKLMFTIHLTGV